MMPSLLLLGQVDFRARHPGAVAESSCAQIFVSLLCISVAYSAIVGLGVLDMYITLTAQVYL